MGRIQLRVVLVALLAAAAGTAAAADSQAFADAAGLVSFTDGNAPDYTLKPGEFSNSANDITLTGNLILSNAGTTLRIDPNGKSPDNAAALTVGDFTLSAGRLETSGSETGTGSGLSVTGVFTQGKGGDLYAVGGENGGGNGLHLGSGSHNIDGMVTYRNLGEYTSAISADGTINFGPNAVLAPVIDFANTSGSQTIAGNINVVADLTFEDGSKLLPYYLNTHELDQNSSVNTTHVLQGATPADFSNLDTEHVETLTIGSRLPGGGVNSTSYNISLQELYQKANASDYVSDINEKKALDYIQQQTRDAATRTDTFILLNDTQNNIRDPRQLQSYATNLRNHMDTNKLYGQMRQSALSMYDIGYDDFNRKMGDLYNYLDYVNTPEITFESQVTVIEVPLATSVKDRILNPATSPADRLALLAAMTPQDRLDFLLSLSPEELLKVLAALSPQDALAFLKAFSGAQWKEYFKTVDVESVLSLVMQLPPDTLREYLNLLTPDDIAKLLDGIDVDKLVDFFKTAGTNKLASLVERLLTMLPKEGLKDLFKGIENKSLTDIAWKIGVPRIAEILAPLPNGVINQLLGMIDNQGIVTMIKARINTVRRQMNTTPDSSYTGNKFGEDINLGKGNADFPPQGGDGKSVEENPDTSGHKESHEDEVLIEGTLENESRELGGGVDYVDMSEPVQIKIYPGINSGEDINLGKGNADFSPQEGYGKVKTGSGKAEGLVKRGDENPDGDAKGKEDAKPLGYNSGNGGDNQASSPRGEFVLGSEEAYLARLPEALRGSLLAERASASAGNGGEGGSVLSDSALASVAAFARNAPRQPGSIVFWGSPFYQQSSRTWSGGSEKVGGTTLGVTKNFGNLALGGQLSYSHSRSRSSGSLSDSDAYGVTVTARFMNLFCRGESAFNPFLAFSTGFSHQRFDNDRVGVDSVYSAKPHSNLFRVGMNVGNTWRVGTRWFVTPGLSLDYSHIRQSSSREHGRGAMAMWTRGSSSDSLRPGVGVDVMFKASERTSVTVRANYRYEVLDRCNSTFSSFMGQPLVFFDSEGKRRSPSSGSLGAGVSHQFSERVCGGLDYSMSLAERYMSHQFSAVLNVTF